LPCFQVRETRRGWPFILTGTAGRFWRSLIHSAQDHTIPLRSRVRRPEQLPGCCDCRASPSALGGCDVVSKPFDWIFKCRSASPQCSRQAENLPRTVFRRCCQHNDNTWWVGNIAAQALKEACSRLVLSEKQFKTKLLRCFEIGVILVSTCKVTPKQQVGSLISHSGNIPIELKSREQQSSVSEGFLKFFDQTAAMQSGWGSELVCCLYSKPHRNRTRRRRRRRY
jgi:hypothetical protein